MTKKLSTAIFAGGCFWCIQAAFANVEGIVKSRAGYIGGTVAKPTYEQVCSGNTGHYEALELQFDSEQVSYPELLQWFWRNIDPTDTGGQFADRGTQYYTAIFYSNEQQKKAAEISKAQAAQRLNAEIITAILPATTFYPAEDYHQNYFTKQAARYQSYHHDSGRLQRLQKLWGKY